MKGGGNRRRISKAPTGLSDRAQAPPPLPVFDFGAGGRDSDVSLCSSRPSSAGGRPTSSSSALLTDRSAQAAALRAVNAFLFTNSAPVSLKQLPSARDITDALRFILSGVDWPLNDLDDDLPSLLRLLHCPIKLNRSALKAPGTPHSWPPFLSVLHWLVQLASVVDHLAANPSSPSSSHPNDVLFFVTRSYALYISGEDEEVANLDEEYLAKAQHQTTNAVNAVAALEKDAADLDAKLQALRGQPSQRETLEREKTALMEDAKKFQAVVDSWGGKVAAMEAALVDWEKELDAKEKETKRLYEENQELEKRVDSQAVNVRDVERMKRELQTVERDIAEAESARNTSEESAWELDALVGRKLNELEVLLDQCNQAVRK